MALDEKFRRIDELCSEASKKSDVRLMRVLRDVLRSVANRNEAMCADILQEVETICLDNGLTRKECVEICSGMVDQDGKKGGRWTEESVKAWLRKSDIPECEEGSYNLNALVCAMNMMWADHTRLVRKIAVETSMTDEDVCYALAHDVLKDCDKAFEIRRYFRLE